MLSEEFIEENPQNEEIVVKLIDKIEENAESTNSDNELRVKLEVNEINGTQDDSEADSTPASTTTTTGTGAKRKLPSWMLAETTETDGSSTSKGSSRKKCKTIEDDDNKEYVCSSSDYKAPPQLDEKPADSIAPASSTAASDVSVPDEQLEENSINIKQEPAEAEPDADNDNEDLPQSSNAIGTINPKNIKLAVKVEKADATSSTTRESCKFGIRCYRRNPMHRIEEAHPGDQDYKRPSFPAPPVGTPDCPFGNSCYRRNPVHFQQYNHPADTDFAQNYKNYRMRLRKRQQQQQNRNDSDSELDDYDVDDPFIDDAEFDSDYVPSNDEEDVDDDDGDKAEE